jgi:hypothetical protein
MLVTAYEEGVVRAHAQLQKREEVELRAVRRRKDSFARAAEDVAVQHRRVAGGAERAGSMGLGGGLGA